MRLEADFEMNTNWLVKDYRRIFMSLIKSVFTNYDPLLCTYLYGTQEEKKIVYKPFTFFVRFHDYEGIDEKRILCGNRLSFTFSSNDEKLFVAFYNGLLQGKKIVIGKNYPIVFTLKGIHLLPEKKITSEKVMFKTIAPVLVNITGNDFYLLPSQPEFPDAFKKNITIQATCFHINCNEDMIQYKIDAMKRLCVSHFKQTMTSWLGKFTLEAPIDVLQMIYDTGLGIRRSQGFGLLEIIRQY